MKRPSATGSHGRRRTPSAKLPISGSEPVFTDLVYGSPVGKVNNNCYAWALDEYRDSGGIKLQPGDLSRQSTNYNSVSCPFLKDRTLDDNKTRGIYMVDPKAKCRRGFYKIMAFIDKGNDYHWYKQHKDLMYRVSSGETVRSIAKELGVPPTNVVSPSPRPKPGDLVYVKNAKVFSHKQGFATGPLLRDASRRVIPDPRRANRNYGMYNYRTFCGAMCLRNAKPSQNQALKLQGLLDKRVRLLDARGKQPNELRAGGAKVQSRHARNIKVQNVRP